jgi:pimeloyl-ACP methyl ester carboxylesterase
MHIHCTGAGGPTVVLDSGWPDTMLVWGRVQPEVAEFAQVCSYDRAGLGWSETNGDGKGRTAGRAVEELRMLLAAADIPGPYVLVGHSLGGAHMHLFAARYPREVAGLVLVDAATYDHHAHQVPEFKGLTERLLRQLWLGRVVAPLGLPRLILPDGFTPSQLPEDLKPASRAMTLRARQFRAAYAERASLGESLEEVEEAVANFTVAAPTVVISSRDVPPGFPVEESDRLHMEAQERLVASMENGTHLIAEDSDHYVQLAEPELVVEAIRSLVEDARQDRSLGWRVPSASYSMSRRR